MKIYKTDSSKLIKIGEPGYIEGQEQAKEYFTTFPQGEFSVDITDKKDIETIFSMSDITNGDSDSKIILSVDNENIDRLQLTICYMIVEGNAAHRTISYKYCEAESDYVLAKKIYDFVGKCQ